MGDVHFVKHDCENHDLQLPITPRNHLLRERVHHAGGGEDLAGGGGGEDQEGGGEDHEHHGGKIGSVVAL